MWSKIGDTGLLFKQFTIKLSYDDIVSIAFINSKKCSKLFIN